MENSRQFGQSGIGANVQFGRRGVRLKNDSDVLAARNAADNAYIPVAGADPTTDNEFVTKRYLETHANINVTVQINGGAPGTPTTGQIGVVTVAGGTYALGELYRGVDSAWVEVVLFDGMVMTTSDALTGGTLEFLGSRLYVYDLETTTWIDGGAVTTQSGFVKTSRTTLSHDTTSPFNIGSALPANARTILFVVDVTQAFNGTDPTIIIGDAGDTDRLVTLNEVDLMTTGKYCGFCPNLYGSETQVIATYVASTSTVGTATVELMYSLV